MRSRVRRVVAGLVWVLVCGVVGAPSVGAQGRRDPSQLIEPDQRLVLGTALGLPQTLAFDVSPDGRRAVLAVAIGSRSSLFLAAARAQPSELTRGRRWDSSPRFLPDGLGVVFVSGRRPRGLSPEEGRLYRLSLGGEPEALTGEGLLVRAPAPSPDGDWVAFLGRVAPEEGAEAASDSGLDVWVVPAAGGEARRRTEHPGDEGPPVWSPDGSRLAYGFEGGLGLVALDVALDAEAPADPLVLASDGVVRGAPDWTPDGGGVVWAGATASEGGGGFDAIFFAAADGASPPYPLIATERDLSEPRFRPTADPSGDSEDELELAWIEADAGSRRIQRSRLALDADGGWAPEGRTRVVTRGAGVASGLRWKQDGSALVALHEAAAFPRDVWSYPLTGGRERISDTLLPDLDVRAFARPERIEIETDDGLTVGAFLYRPVVPDEADEPQRPAPLLVHLRGPIALSAPTGWTNGFDPVVQLFVERGYAVLIPNLRGSGGRGAAFVALNDADWGGGDLDDLIAATRHAQTLPGISPDDACVFGVGYGGFLTLAALARHPDFYDCGVEAMGTADLHRLHRALDPVRRAALETELGPLRGNLARYRELSLNGEGAAIRAPLLSFHGEDIPEAPLEAKQDFLAELRERADYPLVELYFRGDMGRSVFRWETDRGASYAFFAKIFEFLSLHLPSGR